MGVFDFKAIKRKLDRQDQKAEFEAKLKAMAAMCATGQGGAARECHLSSLAHPEWPYTGTPHEWPKIKI